MTAILTLILPFFLIIACGFFAAKRGLITGAALGSLNAYLLYFALPGMFISRLSDIDLAGLFDARLLLAFMIGNFAIWLISTLTQYGLFRKNLSQVAALNTAAGWGNSGYMGIPISIGLLGSAGLLYAFALLAADILVLSALAFVLHGLHQNGGRIRLVNIGGQLAKAFIVNPFMLPFLIGGGISWFALDPPPMLMNWATMLGDSAFAVALFTIGAGMALRPLQLNSHSLGAVLPSTILKLLVHPLASGGVAWALGLDLPAIAIIAILTATPTATNAYILASKFKTQEAEAAATIFLTTVVSVATLPLFIVIFSENFPKIAS